MDQSLATESTKPAVTHTPGPWRVGTTAAIVKDLNGRHVADIYGSTGTRMANARLIAAAPELLAAVKELSNPEVQGTINQPREARIYALIVKAEGHDS